MELGIIGVMKGGLGVMKGKIVTRYGNYGLGEVNGVKNVCLLWDMY